MYFEFFFINEIALDATIANSYLFSINSDMKRKHNNNKILLWCVESDEITFNLIFLKKYIKILCAGEGGEMPVRSRFLLR